EFSSLNIHQQTMDGNFRTNERALAGNVGGFDDILPIAAEHAEEFGEVIWQHMALNANSAKLFEQLHRSRLADLAIGVADNRDFLSALHRAGERERAHRAALRSSDD